MDDTNTGSVALSAARTDGGTTYVTLCGELDLSAVIALGPALDDLTTGPRPDMVLDLRSVTFVDCCGLGLLCRARRRACEAGGRLRLAGTRPGFARLLRHAGLSDAFELCPEPVRSAA
ncbi:STAS domain-containing protein [Streptomyces sp. NPDC004539]|uniref:STAS domain-containing protein n=1 Tax=Streptomyces sp. NPDC004539 TaxID=3154280 RepID=UPI0033B82C25